MSREKMVEIGMATVSAKGLILNGRIYTNPSMMKHQWFEHAKQFGEWQCPVGYFPNRTDHIVLFNIEGLEVASCVEHQQNTDIAVLEAYYDALNNLKALMQENKRKKDD